MLDDLTNTELIAKTLADAGASQEEIALAERLQAAIEALDDMERDVARLRSRIDQLEAPNG